MMQDAQGTNHQKKRIRGFFAIPLSEAFRQKLFDLQKELYPLMPNANFISPENFHITLHFVSVLNTADIDLMMAKIDELLVELPIFNLMIGGLEFFPNEMHPKVISVTVSSNEALEKLARIIAKILRQFKYEIDVRAYRPHITVVRVKPTDTKEVTLPQMIGAEMPVNEIILFHSQPQQGRSLYVPLRKLTLAKHDHLFKNNN